MICDISLFLAQGGIQKTCLSAGYEIHKSYPLVRMSFPLVSRSDGPAKHGLPNNIVTLTQLSGKTNLTHYNTDFFPQNFFLLKLKLLSPKSDKNKKFQNFFLTLVKVD